VKKMQLYEFAPTRSIRVRWTLQELGVNFEAVTVKLADGKHRRPEFLKINPAGRLSVLVDGDFLLTESVAIVLYLAEKYSHKGLLPIGLTQDATVCKFFLYQSLSLDE
jgi:glutathione S-transferase